ncbi:hypothetical protein SMA5143A_7487 [Streptomyces sp. MA5143a]|nr:hypothetical protein SMA5143A_7487 [Streptomyces sp. MA5143a]
MVTLPRRGFLRTAGRKDRDRCVSGRIKQTAVKATVLTDGEGRVLRARGR